MSKDYTSKLVSRGNVKKFALEQAALRKDATFERISGEFYTELNDKVIELIKTHVASYPAQGKTIFGFSRVEPKDQVDGPVKSESVG